MSPTGTLRPHRPPWAHQPVSATRGTDANILEFVAVTKGGQKAYESAIELDTNAINFNLGMILIGLDQSRSVVPKMHLDPTEPKGDPVEIFIEWDGTAGRRRIRGCPGRC